jgi:uncharacterized membrane protein
VPQNYAVGAGAGGRAAFSPGDAITFAWERVKADPGTILGAIIVALILSFSIGFLVSFIVNMVSVAMTMASSAAVGAGRRHVGDVTAAPLFLGFGIVGVILHIVSLIVNVAVSSFFTAGMANFALKVAKGAPYAFGDIFAGGRFFIGVLVAQFLIGLGVTLGVILLIVPGVILALGLSMSLPLIIDRNLGPIDAMTESWKLTDGNKVNIFLFWLIAVGLSIAGACACGVGILLVAPLLWVAYFYVYLKLTGQPVAQAARAV